MTTILFSNQKLLRDVIITWVIAFAYPFMILGITALFGGADQWRIILSMGCLIYVYTVPMTIRLLRTNVIHITEDFGQMEIVVQTFTGKKTYTGFKREFSFALVPDKWNRQYTRALAIYFDGKRIARQFGIGLRRGKWVEDIGAAIEAAGMKVEK